MPINCWMQKDYSLGSSLKDCFLHSRRTFSHQSALFSKTIPQDITVLSVSKTRGKNLAYQRENFLIQIGRTTVYPEQGYRKLKFKDPLGIQNKKKRSQFLFQQYITLGRKARSKHLKRIEKVFSGVLLQTMRASLIKVCCKKFWQADSVKEHVNSLQGDHLLQITITRLMQHRHLIAV